MSVTIATRPIYPLPGEVTVSFTATVGDAVRCWMVDAPDGSQSKADVTAAAGPVMVYEGDADRAWRWQPDAPGIYVVRVDELSWDVAGYRGGCRIAPERAVSEQVVSQQTVKVVVGAELKQGLGWGTTAGKLTIHLFDSTVRQLTQPVNGQDSPRLDPGSSSTINTAEVQAAIAGIAGYTESTLLSSAPAILGALILQFNTHVASLTYHSAADTSNAVPTAMATLTSPKGMAQAVTALQDSLGRHIRDYKLGTTPTDTGFGKGGYHGALSTVGLPQAPAPAGSVGLYAAIGDLLVACIAHFADDDAHLSTGPSVVATALHSLLHVHYRAAQAIRQQSATLTQTEHAGLPDLLTSGGFSR